MEKFATIGDASVTISGLTFDAERHIEYCARFCYDTLDNMTDTSYKTFLPARLRVGHFSILSHAHCTFFVEGISRACSHQLVRHAHLRYLQRSQRYCSEDIPVYVLPDLQGADSKFKKFMQSCWKMYRYLRDRGAKKEDARFVLPNACKTHMAISGTLQGWWDFLRLRLDKHAQWEIRDVAKMIYKLLNSNAPYIFNKELIVVQPPLNLEIPE